MNKQELIKKMAQEAGITQIQAKSALQAFEHGAYFKAWHRNTIKG